MKSKLFMFAVAAAALASCSSDEIVQVNEGNAISFTPVINNQTRGLDITTTALDSFTVTALKGTGAAYFDAVGFKKNGSGEFVSTPKYYWPATDALDFFAYAFQDETGGQVAKLAYNKFTVKPDQDYTKQVDLVYAATKGKTKANDAKGVVLNFRHTGAKIRVLVKNTSETLKFDLEGWKVGFLSSKADFTFGEDNTDVQNATTLALSNWGNYDAQTAGNQYAVNFTKMILNVGDTQAQELPGEMILLPQLTEELTQYESAGAHANVTAPYIAAKVIIRNNDADGTVVASADNGDAIWATWPLPTRAWEPGKVYTYIIDLAGGGFFPDNKPGTDPELDPLLDEIKFVDVTVDDWADGGTWAVGE